MKNIIVLLVMCFLLAGCSQASRLDELLTLKGLADEQGEANKQVEADNERFDLLLEEAKAGKLDQYTTKDKVQAAFGDPVIAREEVDGEEVLEMWLYRHATEFFGADKVYFYFNPNGDISRVNYVEGDNGEIGEETAPEDGREEI